MSYLFIFFIALVISMSVIPAMVRLSPRFGMMDYPDARKVHAHPIPRVGGIGIILGVILPVMIWLPFERSLQAFLLGAVFLAVFGIRDDIGELGHKTKFVGQVIAAVIVVYYGNIYVPALPFMGPESFDPVFAKPFTVFAIVGMINALNASDGLDGLAGGLSLLSFCGMGYLAYQASGVVALVVIAAALGGVLGFLRFNTHPARVFMGDAGSQFLGFTLAFLAIFLTQKINPALSPALPLLFLGLPIADILFAASQRAYSGISPFVATRHHIHHRLLGLGFDHYEAVVIIYSIQAFFIVSAVFMSYETDALIIAVYLGTCMSLFLFLMLAKRKNWRAHQQHGQSGFRNLVDRAKQHRFLTRDTTGIVAVVIPFIFLGTSLLVDDVPRDFGIGSGILAVILALVLAYRKKELLMVSRVVSYVTAAFIVYLETKYIENGPLDAFYGIVIGLYLLLALSIWLAVRYASAEFRASPMDFLVIFVVLTVAIISRYYLRQDFLGLMAIKLVILFYGCELTLGKFRKKWNLFSVSTLLTLSILSVRSLI